MAIYPPPSQPASPRRLGPRRPGGSAGRPRLFRAGRGRRRRCLVPWAQYTGIGVDAMEGRSVAFPAGGKGVVLVDEDQELADIQIHPKRLAL